MVKASVPLYPAVGVYVSPEGVIEVLPDDAVALKPPNVPCEGEELTDHVSVWLASMSLTVNNVLIDVALAPWHTVTVDVPLVKEGVVLLTAAVTCTVMGYMELPQPPEALTVRLAEYVPTAASAGTIILIGDEGNVALVTLEKPAVIAAEFHTML